MRWGLLALALLLIPLASAATIRGVIYTEELTIAENVILTISTSPQLRVLVPDGAYEVELPPGKYALAITQLGTNITLTEQLTVAQEGIFTHDIFLLPDLTEEDELYDELVGDFESPPEDFTAADGSSDLSSRLIVGALLIIVIGGAGHWALRHSRKKRSTQTKRVKEETVPDEYLARVVAILKEEDGRTSQKELRKKLPLSEAKVSLIVSELEAKGRIEKIRKGRGNILVLKR